MASKGVEQDGACPFWVFRFQLDDGDGKWEAGDTARPDLVCIS